ncbi:hypothetical protein [Paenibacillus sp. 481]|uniref:hypothetical protein n=1 Tax=Paenibacillus sp. 481 TaxID=2835869 RepID=UPI001E5E0E56|nr:hypothetical protein [Paenibacillus sp. 481]UHA74422.1 hypothetical protein KIK04_04760 [Paenibacillus sp. 481]
MEHKQVKLAVEQVFDKYRLYRVVILEGTPEAHFLNLIETIVGQLEPDEQFLIEQRYMKSKRITDTQVYSSKFDPPISAVTYSSIRKAAFEKLMYAFGKHNLGGTEHEHTSNTALSRQ